MNTLYKPSVDITVAICTFNRAVSLAGTLATAAALKVPPGLTWEILVVDNNSRDETRRVCEGFARRLPLRYVREERQGLSYARNRALKECRGALLVFTDDDVRLDEKWLERYWNASSAHPEADFFGGRILPLWPNGRPRWMKDESLPLISGLLVRFDLGPESRALEVGDPLPYGASFAIRRRLFERVAPFRIDLGVSGSVPGRGEEAEYLGRSLEAGSKGTYVAGALCWHVVDERRLRVGYLYRFGIQKGIAEVRIRGNGATRGSWLAAAWYLVRGIAQFVRGRGDRYRQCVINAGIQRGLAVSRTASE